MPKSAAAAFGGGVHHYKYSNIRHHQTFTKFEDEPRCRNERNVAIGEGALEGLIGGLIVRPRLTPDREKPKKLVERYIIMKICCFEKHFIKEKKLGSEELVMTHVRSFFFFSNIFSSE